MVVEVLVILVVVVVGEVAKDLVGIVVGAAVVTTKVNITSGSS